MKLIQKFRIWLLMALLKAKNFALIFAYDKRGLAKTSFSFSALIFTMVFLYIGGFLAGILLPTIGWTTSGIYGGLITALIQVIVLAFLGLIVKLDIWKLLIGVVMILVGGIIGGMVAEAINIGGFYSTFVVLGIQSACLLFTGVIKGKPKLG